MLLLLYIIWVLPCVVDLLITLYKLYHLISVEVTLLYVYYTLILFILRD